MQINLLIFLGDGHMSIGAVRRCGGRLGIVRGRLPLERLVMFQTDEEFDPKADEQEEKAWLLEI